MSDISQVGKGKIILAASISFALNVPCLAGVSAPRYTISELTAPVAGATDFLVSDINNSGDFVFQFNDPSTNSHYQYVTNGNQTKEIGRIRSGADTSNFVSYNQLTDDGSLVGYTERRGPYISTSGFSGFLQAPKIPGADTAFFDPQRTQNGGISAGNAYAYRSPPEFRYFTRAIRWDGLKASLLETPEDSWSSAVDMNSRGVVVGNVITDDGGGPVVPTLWVDQRAFDLGIPGVARRINDDGEIAFDNGKQVGVSTTSSVTWLPNLPGTMFASVRRFRDRNLVVGYSVIGNQEPQLQVTTAWINGRAYRMQDLLETKDEWVPLEITDMNDDGWVIGTGFVNGREASFLMKPAAVPLPAGVWAAAITLPLVWWRARRA